MERCPQFTVSDFQSWKYPPGLVDANASTLECIKSFEKIVQERVPRRIEGSFLMTGIPCKVAFLISLPSMAVALDHSAVRLRHLLQETIDENSVWEAAAEILKAANQESWMPIAIGLVGILSGTRERGPCCENCIILLCFFLLVMGLWLPAAPLIPRTADLIHAPDIRCLLFGATFAMQCTMLWCLYSSSSVFLRFNRRYEGKCSGPEIIEIAWLLGSFCCLVWRPRHTKSRDPLTKKLVVAPSILSLLSTYVPTVRGRLTLQCMITFHSLSEMSHYPSAIVGDYHFAYIRTPSWKMSNPYPKIWFRTDLQEKQVLMT